LLRDDEVIDLISHIPETCILDICDSGPHTLEEIAGALGVTRERIRQIEEKAMRRLASTKSTSGILNQFRQLSVLKKTVATPKQRRHKFVAHKKRRGHVLRFRPLALGRGVGFSDFVTS
jgi:hypothetical protein